MEAISEGNRKNTVLIGWKGKQSVKKTGRTCFPQVGKGSNQWLKQEEHVSYRLEREAISEGNRKNTVTTGWKGKQSVKETGRTRFLLVGKGSNQWSKPEEHISNWLEREAISKGNRKNMFPTGKKGKQSVKETGRTCFLLVKKGSNQWKKQEEHVPYWLEREAIKRDESGNCSHLGVV